MASKLGHLTLLASDWLRDLVAGFERGPDVADDSRGTPWVSFDPTSHVPLSRVWAVGGSYVEVRTHDSPPREMAFVKTSLNLLDRERMNTIHSDFPHPLDLADAMRESGVFHTTAFPLRNVRSSRGNNYTAVRHIIRDSIRLDENGEYLKTLKRLAYREWQLTPTKSPDFQCPHCEKDIADGLPTGVDDGV